MAGRPSPWRGSASYQRRLLKGQKMAEIDGWNYSGTPAEGRDARKLVTLTDRGMEWVGIRAWHHAGGYWMNGSEPERATVKAWRDLPEPAVGFWVRGNLHIPKKPNDQVVRPAACGRSEPTPG